MKQIVAKSSHKLSPKLVINPSPKFSLIPADPQKNHPVGWNKKWQNCHMNFHQIRWSYHHLNYHQFWQIPPKITTLGEKRWTNHQIDCHQIQADSPKNHYINPNRLLVHLILTGTAKNTTVSLYYNFIQPVGRASSLSCSGHRGYKLCSLDDRRKTRMRTTVVVFLQFRSKLSELITGLDWYNDNEIEVPLIGMGLPLSLSECL